MSSKTKKRSSPSPERSPQPAPRDRSWLWYALGLFVVLFAAFEIYGPALRSSFQFDDRYLPFLRPGFGQAPLRIWLSGVRPLLMASFWTNYQLSQADPYSYHVVNLLFHFADSILVCLIVRRILQWAGVSGGRLNVLAVFGGLLFLFHPLQTESVTYVASRSENQSVFFFNAAFTIFLYRRKSAVSFPVALAILVLFGVASLTKEHAAVLPALLLLTDYFWNPGFSLVGIRRNWKLYVPVLIGGMVAVRYVAGVLAIASTAGFGMKDLPWYHYFFSQCRAIWIYIRMFFFPYDLNVDHEFAVSRSVFEHGAIVGLAALVAVAAFAWIKRREYKLFAYGYFAFLLLLAPTSSVVPIRDLLVERRVYLAFFPLMLMCFEFLRRRPISVPNLAGALAVVLLVFSFVTYSRNTVWADSISLWTDTAEKSPHKSRPRFQLAHALYTQGQCAQAVEQYQRAAQLEPPDASLYIDWGLAYDCAGQPQQAIEKLKQALALESTAHTWSQIGMIHAKRKEREAALQALAHAEAVDPRFAMTYVYRGNLLLLYSEFDAAAEQFQKALALEPGEPNAVNGLDLARRRVIPAVR